MTERRRAILEAIQGHWDRTGIPPTIREVMRAVGLHSTSSTAYHLDALQREGFVSRSPRLSRSLKVERWP